MKAILFKQIIFPKRLFSFLCFVFLSLQIIAQPVNDNCAAATSRTSSTTCTNATYTLNAATPSGGVPAGCLGGTHYDVWFQFTAISSTHTATISSLGTSFTNPEIQLFSGACGSLTSVICGTTTLTATGLIIGNTYFLRVSNVGAAIASNGGFRLCVTHPGAPPANDECAGAITLTSATSCSNTQYSMRYAAISSGIPVGCAAVGLHYDVWFKFIAVSTSQTVTLSGLGTDLTNPKIQLFSGTCGTLSSIICGTTSLTGTGLTIGNTYYVRISNLGTMPTTSTANSSFNICLTHPNPPPANDDCTGATLLTSGNTCAVTTGNLRFATSNGPAGGCGTGVTAANTFDVWYRFVAVNAAQTVTVGNLGANMTGATTYMQVMSGACGAPVSLACQTVATTNGRVTVTGLTVGATYFVRVYVLLSPTATATADWNFDICVQNPPANDECAGAVNLISGPTCTTTSGTMDLSRPSAGIPAGCVPGGSYDVWYKFTATAVSHTISLSSLGSNLVTTNVRIQILSGPCGTLTSLGCVTGTTTLTQAGLTPGNVYFVRIAYPTNPAGIGTTASFNICITTVAASAPANDLCSGAILLVSGSTCTNILGTLINATATAGLPVCGNANSPEVWYKFVAQSAYPIITLGSVGGNLTTAVPRIQLFSGSCGSLTQLTGACVASPLNTLTAPGGAGLTVGATYYVRITTLNLAAPVTTGTYTFNICVTDPLGAVVDYGKSYINLTTGTAGGTINPNDLLQIRATFVIRQTTASGKSAVDSLAYYDTLHAGQGFHLEPDSMGLRTNEGKKFRPTNLTNFTDAKDLDAAWINTAGAGTDTTIQINMGVGASYYVRGRLGNTHRPSNFANTCIIMATYVVRVNAAYGTKIDYGGGAFKYRDSATGVFYTVTFPKDTLMVYASPGACPDATSPVNVVGDEFNGTFGAPAASAGSQNRGTSPNTSYLYKTFASNTPDDYYYGVANNTSATFVAVQTAPKNNSSPTRVFNLWDITGDHTGASNTAKGNPPCNPALPISVTNPCGYMIAINSAYHTDAAFEFNVNGACTETYYEISAWIKNICYKCGCDSNGVSSNTANYKPTDVGDSSGVRPNIAFQIDGVDYYTTGDLIYQGLGGTQTGSDTLNKWVKRSFVYKTSAGQSSFRMTFRNNAPGGGGNDWVMDDISIRTCYPNMTYSPSISPSVCAGRTITLSDTVRSYYNVYIYYKWQRSTDGGTNWVDLPGTNGVASPTMIGPNNYQYINSYTLPPSATAVSNNGNLYRMVVATNASNLAGSCNYSDVAPVVLTVLNNCKDIDDDNDGIPDYVEFNNPVALQDANGNGIPNWNDITYPGYIDNNADSVNDNFDYGADVNDDGIPNYLDPTFSGFVDSNADGVNDNADKDLDGIINQYDLDSDNDGIPDVVESYGVDTNGDGVIDNYVDTDNDGFSQNVDANNTGVKGSFSGLGAQDFDGDGVPNYLDTDSDSDGIPDVVEAGGSYITNSGRLSNFLDLDHNGLSDNNTGVTGLLKSGADISPVDGRADDYPNKNLDRDYRPSAYDLDSDGDGITDVIEAGLPDADLNGKADGANGTNGWSATVSALPALNVPNTDGVGNPDFLDIDSDDDGIPDNIEGMSTASYIRPTSTTDTDGDGLINHYDNSPSFGGSGIFVYDHDSDGTPDYRDLDTDSDGQADIIEGNDFNLNGLPDDLVTLTGLDTDGDGLDNRFDSLNSVTNIKGTSYRMGSGGSFTGDAAPGTRATVQRTLPAQTDRDWRYISTVLPVQFLNFAGLPQDNTVLLNWSIITPQDIDRFEVERSTDNSNYLKTGTVTDPVKLNEQQNLSFTDDITGISNDIIYYRLKVIAKTGETKYSNVLVVRRVQTKTLVDIIPNPASNYVNINLHANKNSQGTLTVIDKLGRKILTQEIKIVKGTNNFYLPLEKYGQGVYSVVIETATEKINKQLIIVR